MSSVGAFQGKAGYQEQYQNEQSSDFHVGSEQDSYLGKSLLKNWPYIYWGHLHLQWKDTVTMMPKTMYSIPSQYKYKQEYSKKYLSCFFHRMKTCCDQWLSDGDGWVNDGYYIFLSALFL